MKRLILSFLSVAMVTGMLVTITGCPAEKKTEVKKTTTSDDKTKTETKTETKK